MKTFFKSDFEFMQTFMTDLNQELKYCRVSCSPMYNKGSELTTISIDIADKMGDVFLSIDLFKTWDLVRDGKINYSKVLASALTSAENAMNFLTKFLKKRKKNLLKKKKTILVESQKPLLERKNFLNFILKMWSF